jgi:hypothetical protein
MSDRLVIWIVLHAISAHLPVCGGGVEFALFHCGFAALVLIVLLIRHTKIHHFLIDLVVGKALVVLEDVNVVLHRRRERVEELGIVSLQRLEY